MSQRQNLTDLLHRWSAGDTKAFEAVMEVAYARLHRMARHQAGGERNGHTLQPTAILHEAVLRLLDLDALAWSDRAHFYAVAARMMRRVLVDYARQKRRRKRGGDRVRVTLDQAAALSVRGRPPELEALDDALLRLEARDPRKARIVELRFFAGLTGAEIARCLHISTPTVQREWRRARTWLYAELSGDALGG